MLDPGFSSARCTLIYPYHRIMRPPAIVVPAKPVLRSVQPALLWRLINWMRGDVFPILPLSCAALFRNLCDPSLVTESTDAMIANSFVPGIVMPARQRRRTFNL